MPQSAWPYLLFHYLCQHLPTWDQESSIWGEKWPMTLDAILTPITSTLGWVWANTVVRRNTFHFRDALIGPLNGLDHQWPCPGWSTKANCKPNLLDILGNHPGISPNSHPIYFCLLSACFPLSGTILLADFGTCFWLTWIWQPFGFHILCFGTSPWFKALPAPLASESPIASSWD